MLNVVTVLLLVVGAQEGVKIPKGTLYRVPEPRVFQFDGSSKNSVLYREDFETGASGWTITNGVWEIGSPSSGPDTAHGGSSCAATVLDGNYPNNANTRLISPSINLPALTDSMSHLMLSFWHWFQIESGYDYGYVEISTDGGSSWTQVGSSVSGDGSSWRQYTVMLDQFAGQTINIGFRFTLDHSVTYAGWYIDDVAVVLLQPEPINVEIRNISTGMFPFVFLTVSADTFGSPIYTLNETNFQVFENGVSQRDYFEVTPPDTSGGVRAVDIVFCMDNSGSMEDEIAGVSQHVSDFVQQLQQSGYDFALGLVRFGGWENSGYPVVEDNGLLTGDINYFINDLWARNYASGGFEPGWDAMVAAATQMHWRPGSQKVIVLITDESPQDNGNYGNYTYDQTVQILTQNNARVFAMIDPSEAPHSPDDYGTIAQTTGGDWFDIQSPMDSLLNAIGGAITSTYVIRYRASDTTYAGQREVVVRLTYDGNSDEDTTYYTAGSAPQIILTDSTRNLINNLTLVQGQEVDVTVYAVDHIPPDINYVRLYYRHHGDASYQVVDMTNAHDSLYAATIPSTVVDTPGIEFYFEASDSLTTVTLPSTNPHTNPFVVAVWPNYAPFIFHIPPSSGSAIQALVFDNTNNIEHVWLFFREVGTIVWDSVEMTVQQTGTIADLASVLGVSASEIVDSANARGLPLTPTHTASIHEGTIGCATTNGAEYYIKAIDNWGIAGFHGLPDDPHVVGGYSEWGIYLTEKQTLIDSILGFDRPFLGGFFQTAENRADNFLQDVMNDYNAGTADQLDLQGVARLTLTERVAARAIPDVDSLASFGADGLWSITLSVVISAALRHLADIIRGIPFVGEPVAHELSSVSSAIENSMRTQLQSFYSNFNRPPNIPDNVWNRITASRVNSAVENSYEQIAEAVSDSLDNRAFNGAVFDAAKNAIKDFVYLSIFDVECRGKQEEAVNKAQNHQFDPNNFAVAEQDVTGLYQSMVSFDQIALDVANFGHTIQELSTYAALIGAIILIILGILGAIVTGGTSLLASIAGLGAFMLQYGSAISTSMACAEAASAFVGADVIIPWMYVNPSVDQAFRDSTHAIIENQNFEQFYAELNPSTGSSFTMNFTETQGLSDILNRIADRIRNNDDSWIDLVNDSLPVYCENEDAEDWTNIALIMAANDSARRVIDSYGELSGSYMSNSAASEIYIAGLRISAMVAKLGYRDSSVTETALQLIDSTQTALVRKSFAGTAIMDSVSHYAIPLAPVVGITGNMVKSVDAQAHTLTVTGTVKNFSDVPIDSVYIVMSTGTQNVSFVSDSAIRIDIAPHGEEGFQFILRFGQNVKTINGIISVVPASPGVKTLAPLLISEYTTASTQPLSNNTVFAYPNPFDPTLENATISYSLSKQGDVTIRIYDVAMNLVRTLLEDQPQQPGQHTVTWDGRDEKGETVANGIYFFVIESSAGERGAGKIAVKK